MAQTAGAQESRTLRERKRERTRQALIDAATDLFDRYGYDQTTVADIAACADIGTRTFFSYFASKEELLFPAAMDERVQAAVVAIATRRADERPADVLLRALRDVGETDTDMVSRLAAVRMRLVRTVPAVRRRALQVQVDAEQEIVGHLHAAFPDDLDEVGAAALVGAFVGAVSGALRVLLADPDTVSAGRERIAARLREATDVALHPWLA
ncbi:MAG: TetR/AcrR family transcriptional regulator [Streptosporangiales bacterium]